MEDSRSSRSTALLATLRSGGDIGGSGTPAAAAGLPALAWVVHCCVLSQGCWELMDCGAVAEEAVQQSEDGAGAAAAAGGGDGDGETCGWNELPGRYLFRYFRDDDVVAAESAGKAPAVVLLLRMIETGASTMAVTLLREGSETPETVHFRTSEELDMSQRSWRARLLRIHTLVDAVDLALTACLASESRASSSLSPASKEKQSTEGTTACAPRGRWPDEESRGWQPVPLFNQPEPLPTPFIPGLPAGARHDPIFPGQIAPPRRPAGEPFPFPPRAPHQDLDPLGIMGGGGAGGPAMNRRPRRGHPDTEMFRDPDEDDDFGLGGLRRPGYY